MPSQKPGPLAVALAGPLFAHVPAWQVVAVWYFLQAPLPSHLPSVPHVLGSDTVQSSRGSRSACTGLHWPLGKPVVAIRHATHLPLHGPSQQTPSLQFPEVHSAGSPHVIPFALFATHFPARQYPPPHSECAVQLALQREPSHTFTRQLVTASTVQMPWPLQVPGPM